MALVVGTNSYVSVAEADAYYTDMMYTDQWFLLDDPSKESALISATEMLDSLCVWNGYKTDPDQALEFPRNGDVEVPESIKIAELHIALEMVKQGISTIIPAGESIKTVKAGTVTLSFYESISTVNTLIDGTTKSLLSPYGVCHFGGGSIQVVPLER